MEATMPNPKNLAVFDFDHTILDDNSDTAMVDMIGRNNVPQEVKELQRRDGWTAFMQGIFRVLYERGATPDDITAKVQNLPSVPGMVNLIGELKKMDYDIIMISDSNSYFIKVYLMKVGLEKAFLRVFTNPAKFVEGKLTLEPYHHQTQCKLSTVNLCKGRVLQEFLDEQKSRNVEYGRVIYVGDGTNDFCPILRLREKDAIFARKGYKLHELIVKAQTGKSFDNSGLPHHIKADFVVWESGDDILQNIKK